MLAIRLQRTGRKGHAQYRVVVQEARLSPTSERVIYRLGNFNPHSKELNIDKEKADFYLKNGAQPSDRIARLFKKEGVSLPSWVKISDPVKRDIRNPEKLRKNRPDEPTESEATAAMDEASPEAVTEKDTAEEVAQADESPAEEISAEETPAEEEKSDSEEKAEEKTDDKKDEKAA